MHFSEDSTLDRITPCITRLLKFSTFTKGHHKNHGDLFLFVVFGFCEYKEVNVKIKSPR
jgi:hypothetical protein